MDSVQFFARPRKGSADLVDGGVKMPRAARPAGRVCCPQEQTGGDYPRQQPTTYHTSPGVPEKNMGLEKSH